MCLYLAKKGGLDVVKNLWYRVVKTYSSFNYVTAKAATIHKVKLFFCIDVYCMLSEKCAMLCVSVIYIAKTYYKKKEIQSKKTN